MAKKEKILDLKPTQFAVGMLEVDEKIKVVKKYSKKELKKYVDETPVPVVRGPDGRLYVVDKHHFLCVCYHVGVRKVRVEVRSDLSRSKLSYPKFWKWMLQHRNSYLYCQFGEGPRKQIYLPRDIRGLADDPYRSLAWFVRKAGGFDESEKNFAEFRWANFFRKRIFLERTGLDGMEKAMARAVKLAQSPSAKRLPGYGKLNLAEVAKVQAKGRERLREAREG